MSPTNDPPRASRWVGTRMFDAEAMALAAQPPSRNLQAPAEPVGSSIPRPRSRTFGVSSTPGLGPERLDGVADFQPQPERRPSHSGHHQASNLLRLRSDTQGVGPARLGHTGAHQATNRQSPSPTQTQWPIDMASPRRASTGDWRDRQNPARSDPYAFPQAIAGIPQPPPPKNESQWAMSNRPSFGLEGILEGERTSYAGALKSDQNPSMPYMGRSQHRSSNSVDYRPADRLNKQAWPILERTQKVANTRNKPLLSLETSTTFEGPQSGSNSGSPHSGRRIDLGGFRPSRMKEEQRGRVAAPTGSNYLGNKQSRRQSPRNPDDPNEDNCALWLTNLPVGLTLRSFLALVNTGQVFAVVFSEAKPPTWTQAVKLVFKTHEAAATFLNQVRSQQGIVVRGVRMEGIWNRNWYPEDRSSKTRVLQIESPAEMTFQTWHDYFDECVVYQIEEELEMPCSIPGKRLYEFRFARVDGQSEAIYQAIAKNSKFAGLRYRYSADPCDPNSGLR